MSPEFEKIKKLLIEYKIPYFEIQAYLKVIGKELSKELPKQCTKTPQETIQQYPSLIQILETGTFTYISWEDAKKAIIEYHDSRSLY